MHRKTTNEKIILGLSNAHHDGSACIVKGGKILAAIECERLTKIKKSRLGDSNLKETIDYVLESVGMGSKDIDYIAVGSYPEELLGNKVKEGDLRICNNVFDLGKYSFIVSHHLSHNSAAYYTSPFDSLRDWHLLRALAIHRPELTLNYHHLIDQEPFDED